MAATKIAFLRYALSRTVKEIEANLCFCHFFWQKFENSKMAAIFGGVGKFCTVQEIEANCVLPFLAKIRLHSLDTLWVENFDEIALSRTVKEIEANLCFAIFGKNSKI